ncbi:hypothetical protein N9948_00490 [bacterium]|nr:hypothetical protein [bacterium]
MITYFMTGAIFNLIFFGLGLDKFIMRVTLDNIQDVEDDFLLSDENKERIEEIKKNCEKYGEHTEHNLLTVAIDLVIYPIYIGTLFFAFMDYIITRFKK